MCQCFALMSKYNVNSQFISDLVLPEIICDNPSFLNCPKRICRRSSRAFICMPISLTRISYILLTHMDDFISHIFTYIMSNPSCHYALMLTELVMFIQRYVFSLYHTSKALIASNT